MQILFIQFNEEQNIILGKQALFVYHICTCDIQSLKSSNFLKVFLAPLIENGIPFKYVLS